MSVTLRMKAVTVDGARPSTGAKKRITPTGGADITLRVTDPRQQGIPYGSLTFGLPDPSLASIFAKGQDYVVTIRPV